MTELSTDNGIFFLDNEDMIKNPTNMKTPPPPMWGDILEEDLYDDTVPFYDHELHLLEKNARMKQMSEMERNGKNPPGSSGSGMKLKRKVIYVYENDNDNTIGKKQDSSVLANAGGSMVEG